MPQSRKRQSAKRRRPSPQTYSGQQPITHKGTSKKAQIIVSITILALLAAGVVYFLTGGKGNSAPGNEITTASGLKYVDLVEGTGATPKPGQTVVVHYTGKLQNGTKFESSLDTGQPVPFVIGRGKVIKGWDEGLMTMKVGGKRRLTIPPNLGYGAVSQPKIPANSTLIFDVELLDIK